MIVAGMTDQAISRSSRILEPTQPSTAGVQTTKRHPLSLPDSFCDFEFVIDSLLNANGFDAGDVPWAFLRMCLAVAARTKERE